jgi:hypothetical protein
MRLIVALLMMALSAPAWAEWVKIAESNLRALYYNPAAISQQGDLRRVWTLQDNKQRDQDGVLSRHYLSEFDCKAGRQRLLSVSTHAERMARGETIKLRRYALEEPEGKWFNVAPNSFSAHLMKLVCAK